jgi:hypothetical protein
LDEKEQRPAGRWGYEGLGYQALTAVVTEQKVMITRLTDAVTVLVDAMTPAPPPRGRQPDARRRLGRRAQNGP